MKVLGDAFRIVSRPDTEPGDQSRLQAAEPRGLSNDDPSSLIELLEDIDGLKHEIHERMRRMEAVRQARAVLMDDAAKTDALNRRLAGLGMGTHAVRSASGLSDNEIHTHEMLRLEAGRAPEPKEHSADRGGLEQRSGPYEVEPDPGGPVPVEPDHFEPVEPHPVSLEVLAFGGRAVASTLSWPGAEEAEVACEMGEAEPVVSHAEPSGNSGGGLLPTEEEDSASGWASQRAWQAEQNWKESEQAIQEARRLMEESVLHLDRASSREEQAAIELKAAQAALDASRQSAVLQVEEAERCWKLVQGAAKTAQEHFEQAAAALVEARTKQDSAVLDLASARQELTTAYQFAAVAAQRRLESREFFERASRWAILATAFSWAVMAWFAWFNFRGVVPIWAPGVISLLILLVASRVRLKLVEDA